MPGTPPDERPAHACALLAAHVQEQAWSDKIRRASTWWTWGLMGLHFASFVAVYTFLEPRKRQALTDAVSSMLQQHTARIDTMLSHLAEDVPTVTAQAVSDSQEWQAADRNAQQQQGVPAGMVGQQQLQASAEVQQQLLVQMEKLQQQLQTLAQAQQQAQQQPGADVPTGVTPHRYAARSTDVPASNQQHCLVDVVCIIQLLTQRYPFFFFCIQPAALTQRYP